MPRPFLYHLFDHDDFAGEPELSSVRLRVPTNTQSPSTAREEKDFYSLKRDLEVLRRNGAAKSIVDASVIELPATTHDDPAGVAGTNAEPMLPLLAIQVGRGADHKVLFTGCHHAREWISVEVVFYIAEYLVNRFTDTPTTDEEKRIKHLLTNRQITFVPMTNPNGHQFTTTTDRWWRANRHQLTFAAQFDIDVTASVARTIQLPAGTYTGVDVNRNYATSDWGTETYHPGTSQRATSRDPREGGQNAVFCGMSAASERETKAIQNLIASHSFRASISYHNFGQDYIFPDGFTGNAYLTDLKDGMDELVRQYRNPYNFRSSSSYRYTTSGDAMDFSFERMPGRPTYVPEVRPTRSDPEAHWFSGLPEDQIEPCVKENLAAALALINAAGFDNAPQAVSVQASAAQPLVQVVRANWEPFRDWNPTWD